MVTFIVTFWKYKSQIQILSQRNGTLPKNVRELEFWKYKSQNQILGQHNGTLPKKRSMAQNLMQGNMIFLS